MEVNTSLCDLHLWSINISFVDFIMETVAAAAQCEDFYNCTEDCCDAAILVLWVRLCPAHSDDEQRTLCPPSAQLFRDFPYPAHAPGVISNLAQQWNTNPALNGAFGGVWKFESARGIENEEMSDVQKGCKITISYLLYIILCIVWTFWGI